MDVLSSQGYMLSSLVTMTVRKAERTYRTNLSNYDFVKFFGAQPQGSEVVLCLLRVCENDRTYGEATIPAA